MLISCASEEQGSPVKETVDTAYLDSEGYQQFKQQASREQQRATTGKDEFAAIIEERIAKDSGRTLSLPAQIDDAMVEAILQKYRKQPPAVIRAFGDRKRYYPIANITRPPFNYNVFMLCEVASYENCLLMLATSRQGEISDMGTIGVFNRSVSYRAGSHISITDKRVNVEITKTVMNPFEQTNTISEAYRISESGKIDPIKN